MCIAIVRFGVVVDELSEIVPIEFVKKLKSVLEYVVAGRADAAYDP